MFGISQLQGFHVRGVTGGITPILPPEPPNPNQWLPFWEKLNQVFQNTATAHPYQVDPSRVLMPPEPGPHGNPGSSISRGQPHSQLPMGQPPGPNIPAPRGIFQLFKELRVAGELYELIKGQPPKPSETFGDLPTASGILSVAYFEGARSAGGSPLAGLAAAFVATEIVVTRAVLSPSDQSLPPDPSVIEITSRRGGTLNRPDLQVPGSYTRSLADINRLVGSQIERINRGRSKVPGVLNWIDP